MTVIGASAKMAISKTRMDFRDTMDIMHKAEHRKTSAIITQHV
jgi:hypothetical protein